MNNALISIETNGLSHYRALDLAASMCNYPVKMSYVHKFTGELVPFYAPCRKCPQCLNTRANDLVQRVFNDACILAKSGGAYFVTLTYPSFDTAAEIPETLWNCLYHLDNDYFLPHKDSKSGRLQQSPLRPLKWSPCLFYYPHFQNFIKLLRNELKKQNNNENATLEILNSVEFGHSFGRPHLHFIALSDVPISYELISDLWIKTIHSPARVDYEDLVINGTLAGKDTKNTKRSVKYLVKYTNKSQNYNTSRLQYALNFFQNNLPYENPARSHFFTDEFIYSCNDYHEKRLQSAFHACDSHSISDFSLQQFACFFGCSHQFSLRTPIGSVYCHANVSRFAQGQKNLPKIPISTPRPLANGSLPKTSVSSKSTFPRNYQTQLERYLCPFVLRRKSLQGSYTSTTFSMQTLNTLREIYDILSPYILPNLSYRLDYYGSDLFPIQNLDSDKVLSHPAFRQLSYRQKDNIKALFWPNDSDKNPTEKKVTYYSDSYIYNYANHTRIRPYLLLGANPYFVLIVERSVDRRFVGVRPFSPFRLIRIIDSYLKRIKREYCSAAKDSAHAARVLDSIKNSQTFCDAIELNRQYWKFFHDDKDNQTKLNNAYD